MVRKRAAPTNAARAVGPEPHESRNVFARIIAILGLAASAVYIGYLAYSIHSTPLWIIVLVTFGLAIRDFVSEYLNGASKSNGGQRSR